MENILSRKQTSLMILLLSMVYFVSYLTRLDYAAVLALTGGSNVFVSVFMAALITGAMHGVNFMFIGLLPRSFGKFGKLSFVTGLLNSSTYVGSAISTYGIAVLSTHFGWGAIAWLWTFLALVPTIICVIVAKPWNKIKNS